MAKKNGTNGAWTAEQFVRVWQTATTCAEVAEAIGVTRTYAYQIAHRIRKAGVPLRKPARGKPGPLANLDVKGLTQIAKASLK